MANDWEIKPSVSAFESFTSNARLDPPGEEKADFVTTVSPALDVHREGPRLTIDLNYALDAVGYVEEQELSELRNRLALHSNATLVPEMLFLDASAAITQVPESNERPTSSSLLTASTNLDTIYTYRISPSIHNHFGTFADSGLGYAFSQVFSDELPDTTIHTVEGSLLSGSRFSRFLWALNANAQHGSGSRDVESVFAAASAEYPINGTISLFGSAGYEQISDSSLDEEPDGPIGSAGVRLSPGPRSVIEVLYNHRFESDFVTGRASYLLGPDSRIDFSYTEQLQTSQSAFSENLGFLRRDEFGNFVDARTERLFRLGDDTFSLEDNAFRLRAFNASLHLVRGRNTWDAIAYHERRDIDALDEQDTAIGGSANWGHRLSPVATLNLTARFRYESFDRPSGTEHQHLVGAAVSMVRNLSETLDAVFTVNFARQFADDSDDEFVEAVVSMGLLKHF
ncbi:TIGR03016 family PEP-CTERM system-associated outer membrane protein [Dongia deserti]|uniref:TIGR03016 family PEP-CTERM system-associated outer membrane protein n=1 Tax=Dongia deserti TaxID=2268030 RepID=UPI000E65E242|nr:TIGR03016 family PEP-CTERM system-associated outer membrane protein [Dongia deserti]